MKKSAVILYLFVVLLQATSTLWILGSFYMNRAGISQNLCINRFDAIPVCRGQCFLVKELGRHEKQEFPDLKQKEMQWFFEVRNLEYNTFCESTDAPVLPKYKASFYNSGFHPRIFHPPQAA